MTQRTFCDQCDAHIPDGDPWVSGHLYYHQPPVTPTLVQAPSTDNPYGVYTAPETLVAPGSSSVNAEALHPQCLSPWLADKIPAHFRGEVTT